MRELYGMTLIFSSTWSWIRGITPCQRLKQAALCRKIRVHRYVIEGSVLHAIFLQKTKERFTSYHSSADNVHFLLCKLRRWRVVNWMCSDFFFFHSLSFVKNTFYLVFNHNHKDLIFVVLVPSLNYGLCAINTYHGYSDNHVNPGFMI